MPNESYDQLPESQNIVLIDSRVLHQAEKLIASCESCEPDLAELPFDTVLDRVTGSDPAITDYILQAPAKCPQCRREINEKTLVDLD